MHRRIPPLGFVASWQKHEQTGNVMIKPLPELQLPPCDLQMVLRERETVRSF